MTIRKVFPPGDSGGIPRYAVPPFVVLRLPYGLKAENVTIKRDGDKVFREGEQSLVPEPGSPGEVETKDELWPSRSSGKFWIASSGSLYKYGKPALSNEAKSFHADGSRLAMIDYDGVLRIQEGFEEVAWTEQGLANVAKVQLSGLRAGALLTNGELYVKEGGVTADWRLQQGNVVDFALSGTRIAALFSNGVLTVKEGALDAGWVEQQAGVTAFQLSGTRIGVVFNGGVLSVKEGALTAGWVEQQSGVTAFQLSGTRIGVVFNGGGLSVKEGTLTAAWVPQTTGVKAFHMDGTRIGAILASAPSAEKAGKDVLYVKDSGLSADWVRVADNAKSCKLAGTRLGVLLTDDRLIVKEAALTSDWVANDRFVRDLAFV